MCIYLSVHISLGGSSKMLQLPKTRKVGGEARGYQGAPVERYDGQGQGYGGLGKMEGCCGKLTKYV